MKQKIFAICDLEEMYAFKMAEYIVEKGKLPYAMHLFTSVEELSFFLQKNEIFILLISESAMHNLQKERDIPNVFVLEETEQEKNTEYVYINKFQSPNKIMKAMLEKMPDLEDWTKERSGQELRLKMIGIYSPVRRCLQTSFALTMGQLLAKEHKVLYLNFECYSGFSQMFHKEFSADMMDVVYYFKCAKEKLSIRLPSIVQTINGLDFIPPGQSFLDMQGISGEKWIELLQMFEQITDYEYLILDLTDGMNGLFELLSHCYKIYTITKDDGFAMAKMHQYEQILQLNAMDNIVGKTVKCRFPFFEKLPSDLNLMTHGELAGYVKAIIQEDLYEQAG
ncbi:MAG: hypothetical protein IJO97_05920 [Lachnospiraceae bacterium]|nr:hypothetical protein [Lachnospiraceae bacterium]